MTGILNRRRRFLFAAALALALAGGVPRPVGAQLMMSEAEEVATGKREDDSPDVNAFALPGGYIYVTRGMVAYLNSEAELAAELGHELGHVTARHSVHQVTASTAAGIGATLLQVLVPQTRGALGDTAISVLGNALLSGYGREHELEADRSWPARRGLPAGDQRPVPRG